MKRISSPSKGIEDEAMIIEILHADNAIVVTPVGEMSHAEAAVDFRNTIKQLMREGIKKIVLDLSRLTYIDSTGIGELVSSYYEINKANGRLLISSPSKKVREILAITKLTSVFRVTSSVEQALRELGAPEIYAKCPAFGCKRWGIIPDPSKNQESIRCTECTTDLTITPSMGSVWTGNAIVVKLLYPTYRGEFVEVVPQILLHVQVRVSGRLNLFAAEVVEKAFRSVPLPRRVIFDLTGVTEISQPGLERIFSLCKSNTMESRAALLAGKPISEVTTIFQTRLLCYVIREEALNALGPAPKNGVAWTVPLHHGAFL
jgi:anti-sigma B factor antagonist